MQFQSSVNSVFSFTHSIVHHLNTLKIFVYKGDFFEKKYDKHSFEKIDVSTEKLFLRQ